MDHKALYSLHETFDRERILLCFNGPFSQGLIEEIGSALKKYLQSEAASRSASLDVFAVYIELAQNIVHYCTGRGYSEAEASSTIVISRDAEGRYVVSAGNAVEAADGEALLDRVGGLAAMNAAALKAAYKEQLRRPREDGASAGLGLLDMARKASAPLTAALAAIPDGRSYFTLRVVI